MAVASNKIFVSKKDWPEVLRTGRYKGFRVVWQNSHYWIAKDGKLVMIIGGAGR